MTIYIVILIIMYIINLDSRDRYIYTCEYVTFIFIFRYPNIYTWESVLEYDLQPVCFPLPNLPRCRSEQHALEYRLDRTWPRLSKFLSGTSGVGSCQEPGWVNMEKLKNRVFCVFFGRIPRFFPRGSNFEVPCFFFEVLQKKHDDMGYCSKNHAPGFG